MIVPVNLGPRSYTILVESGALGAVGQHLAALGVGRRAALVTDSAIMALHGSAVVESLTRAGFAVTVIEVPEGETAKTLAVAEQCWDRLLAAGLDRSSTVLGLGGGAVGDLAGFIAATYMRGMHFVTLPTTVLAQVDASIGGKTAIDHPKAKNLIGAFHQPRLVVVDPSVVRTLPEREFRSGLAEIVKHGIVLEHVIGGSCRLKASVIERDPEEKSDLRFALNYGHTIGHALEAVTGYGRWTHGEAVSLGIAAEARLARRLTLADEATVARQERLLAGLGLPIHVGAIDVEAVLSAMTRDKKARDGRVPFVLAPRLGEFRVVYDVPVAEIRSALREVTS
jgi:3-dehydroquinate synthase